MKHVTVSAVVVAATVLAACGPRGEMSARRAAQLEKLGEQCVERGYERGTAAFDACVRRLDNQAVIERFRRYEQVKP